MKMSYELYKYWFLLYPRSLPRTQGGMAAWKLQNAQLSQAPGEVLLFNAFLSLAPINKHLSKGSVYWGRRHLIQRNMNFSKGQY